MSEKPRQNSNSPKINNSWSQRILAFIVSLLLGIPLFILAYRVFEELRWPYHLDKIILFLLIVGILYLFLKWLRRFLWYMMIGLLGLLIIGSVTGQFGFNRVVTGYKALLFELLYKPLPENATIRINRPFPNKNNIEKAINYREPSVRNFAVKMAGKNFRATQKQSEYRTIIQCFSIFKEIQSRWFYVSDPRSRDYFAKASETIQHLSGDCDDYTILMCACFKAIGGVPRIMRNPTHLYPELRIGTTHDLNQLNFIIKHDLFKKESKDQILKCHTDIYGQIWMNMDYSASYPGGPFLHKEIDGILSIEKL